MIKSQTNSPLKSSETEVFNSWWGLQVPQGTRLGFAGRPQLSLRPS